MPHTPSARAHRGRGLTTAGLIAVTVATLLMMAWAIFPTAALADGTHVWGLDDNKQGSTKLPCADGGHWHHLHGPQRRWFGFDLP